MKRDERKKNVTRALTILFSVALACTGIAAQDWRREQHPITPPPPPHVTVPGREDFRRDYGRGPHHDSVGEQLLDTVENRLFGDDGRDGRRGDRRHDTWRSDRRYDDWRRDARYDNRYENHWDTRGPRGWDNRNHRSGVF